MRILVLNPSTELAKNVIRDVLYGCWFKGKMIGGGTVPPSALLSVATVLKNDGNQVTLLDAQAEGLSIDSVGEMIPEYDIVIVSTSSVTFREDSEYLGKLKERNHRLLTVVIGSHPTFMPHFSLAAEGVDIIVRHEPEFVLRDLARGMRRGDGGWRDVRGIGFRDNGTDVLRDPYPPVDLDELPFPDVTMLSDRADYFNPLVRRTPYITTTTSKGCPALCSFCTAPYFDGMKVRFQSSGYILREIEYFLDKGYREVYFRDTTFFMKKSRDMEWCAEVVKRGLDVTWLANARIAMIDREMMEVAKTAGCHTLKFGIESGNQVILDRMRKGYKVEQAEKVFGWAHEIGIDTHAHVMLGNPGDNLETIEETIAFVKALDPTSATFGICTPFPGTPLFEEVTRINPAIGDGTGTDLSNLHVDGTLNELFTSLTKDELEKSIRRAYREFYLRPSYWAREMSRVRSLDDLKSVSIAAYNFVGFALIGE